MDPRNNPYSPGAGLPPFSLAGRDSLMERVAIALDRIKSGRSARSFIFYGLRGVGKTVLLRSIRLHAEEKGFISVTMEAPEERSLPSVLSPALRSTLLKLQRKKHAKAATEKALKALAGFIKALRIKYHDIEIGLDTQPELGLADSGELSNDLNELLEALGLAAKEHNTALVLYIDELQYVPEDQLAALIGALHHTAQQQLPVAMIGAGLPQLVGQMGRAKSYSERLFEFVAIGSLDHAAAKEALIIPAEMEGVSFELTAIDSIIKKTMGYPYFLQEWGKHCWNLAPASPISLEVVNKASVDALAELDESFFRVRLDRLTPQEKRYMRAMAELGSGPHRSGDIAEKLARGVTSMGTIRNSLIEKGMIYSPAYGETAFTVPFFSEFMKRMIPEFP
ncbi:MAG: ATP-binding protein [Chthoniobacterales bacterium]|nr:ATP-binding protein [Chthoniobacterales bacterium]